MQLPESVKWKIGERAESIGFAALQRAAAAMSEEYRKGVRVSRGPGYVEAYLVTRMPATYAATYSVLEEVRARLGSTAIASVLDLGAGTGAASLAARRWFPEASLTMVERDTSMADTARAWLPEAALTVADAASLAPLPPHDLVLASYALGEMREKIVRRLWDAARVALVVVEPGTTRGFDLIRDLRSELLHTGAHMIAPCPGIMPCPMVPPDWCHFGARVERTSLHRRIKGAELGYEDEKFSYVAVARQPVELPGARIIRRPIHQPGLIVLENCTAEGLRTARVTKRDREQFRKARRAGWGDAGI